MYIPFYSLLLIVFQTSLAQAYLGYTFEKPRYVSMDLQYVTYADISRNSNQPVETLDQTLTGNIHLRFYRIFSLIGTYGQGTNREWSYKGLGIKVDLPGFYWLGGITDEFVRKQKKRPVNTYLSISKYFAKEEIGGDEFINDKFAFGTDIFVAGRAYLNIDVGILSFKGNQFLAPAVGVGYEF